MGEELWGGLNQPTAGARFEQTLPKGDYPSNSIPFQHPMDQGHPLCLEVNGLEWSWL